MSEVSLNSCLFVAMSLKPLHQVIMGCFPGLLDVMSGLLDHCMDATVIGSWCFEVMVFLDCLWDEVAPEPDTLMVRQI